MKTATTRTSARTTTRVDSTAPTRRYPSHILNRLFAKRHRGKGKCYPHFGEFFQGAIATEKNGRAGIVRCLVSVHMPNSKGSEATFTLKPGTTKITVSPGHYTKCLAAVRLMLDARGLSNMGGHLDVTTYVPEGAGQGSSTTGVVAAAEAGHHAADGYYGFTTHLSPTLLANIAVRAEGASDSIMHAAAASTPIFAHREGVVLKTMAPLPEMLILGCDTSGVGVETDRMTRARYTSAELDANAVALALLERGVLEQDVDMIGRVATYSAVLNQRFLPKPKFAEVLALKDRIGAAGVVAAHSGTVLGFMFDPLAADLSDKLEVGKSEIAALGFGRIQSFTTPF